MNKIFKRVSCLALACLTAFPFVACGDEQENDPETKPLVLSTEALDGRFNPFFATSATDVTIAAQTQISMLTLDNSGNIVCGDDYATVALDYKTTAYNAAGNQINLDNATADSTDRTEYEFVIKNGIKFSDGEDLGIDDVLFNLYVYLDPLYMGSSTIYSTKIRGLNAYRTQQPEIDGAAGQDWNDLQQTFYNEADRRIRAVLGAYCGVEDFEIENPSTQQVAQMEADFAKAKEFFREEVESDWNAVDLTSFENEYSFTEKWEAYYFSSGLVSVEYEDTVGGKVAKKDENDKYVTTLDESAAGYETSAEKGYKEDMQAALDGLTGDAREAAMKELATQTVYNYYVDDDFMNSSVLLYWVTADKLREDIASQERTNYFNSQTGEGGRAVQSISGITTYKTSSFNGKNLGEEHDVLKIVIDGVDPKAIYNFSFTVSPMHYYADGNDVLDGAYDNYYTNYNGTNNFGVAFGQKDFFDKVLKNNEKNKFPVGAGPYMATSSDPNENGTATYQDFFVHNVVYFKRNPYFETVGENIENAKIKYLQYRVTNSDLIMESLASGEIDFGTPNATPANVTRMGTSPYKDKLAYDTYMTNGYGYVGVNAKHVQDIRIRRIIMKTMNLAMPQFYYGEDLSDPIYRSMSLTSWANPGATEAYKGRLIDGVFDSSGDLTYYGLEKPANNTASVEDYIKDRIRTELDNIGYVGDGVRSHPTYGSLKYTFTIAGSANDHPAFGMFIYARDILNDCGFEISVRTDANALIKLAEGKLHVWAAAWSSSIDPDMYQVYHRDSTATSVENWGYGEIFKPGNEEKYATEIDIINELSQKIEEGREINDQPTRKAIYAQALDLVMELAVELPTYQRNDMFVYDKTLIDGSTLNPQPDGRYTATAGPLDKIWEVNYL